MRKAIALEQWRRNRDKQTIVESGRAYFQNNWEPEVHCAFQARVGRIGDGGKWVCGESSDLMSA